VRSASPDRVEHLDGWLWSWRDDAFLPHGVAGEPMAERQPVLITTGEANDNAADVLFLIDGAAPGDISGYVRCVLLFDGRDEAAVAAARARWPQFKAAGCEVSYWRQAESGAWRKEG
jgi:DNA polymerase-3 subunit chi